MTEDPIEIRSDEDLEDLLLRSRPVPSAAFRSRLKVVLTQPRPRARNSRARVRALVAAYGACGSLCLAIAALGVAGAGPLAAG
jgi:hypothetical protein